MYFKINYNQLYHKKQKIVNQIKNKIVFSIVLQKVVYQLLMKILN